MKTKCYSYNNGSLHLYSEFDKVYKHPYAVIFSDTEMSKELILSLTGLNEAKIEVFHISDVTAEGVADTPQSYEYYIFLN